MLKNSLRLLLNDKKDLEGKFKEIEKSSGGWLEPAKNFVTTCNIAGSAQLAAELPPPSSAASVLASSIYNKEKTSVFNTGSSALLAT